MATPSTGRTPIELEHSIYHEDILRTQFGWFRVHGVQENEDYTRDQGSSRLGFRLEAGAEVPANDMDIAILRRAKALIANVKDWDREDDRQCTPGKPGLSLYCAMQKASIDASGGFHHRRPAL